MSGRLNVHLKNVERQRLTSYAGERAILLDVRDPHDGCVSQVQLDAGTIRLLKRLLDGTSVRGLVSSDGAA